MTFTTNPLQLTIALVRQRRGLFVLTSFLWLVVHALPVLTTASCGTC